MCYAVYLGTNQTVLTSEWDESNPSFYVQEVVGEEREAVKKQFSMRHIYYVGSHESCGCGFVYDATLDKDDKDINDRKNSVRKFNELLQDVLKESDECELFLCWDGDSGEKPERFEVVGLDLFLKGDWVKDKPTFYRIAKQKL